MKIPSSQTIRLLSNVLAQYLLSKLYVSFNIISIFSLSSVKSGHSSKHWLVSNFLTLCCLLTAAHAEEWSQRRLRGSHRLQRPCSPFLSCCHFRRAPNGATGSCEVDWLHLWSLFSDNVLSRNHALCHCTLHGWDYHQWLHHRLIRNATLIGQIIIIFFIYFGVGSVDLFFFSLLCVLQP